MLGVVLSLLPAGLGCQAPLSIPNKHSGTSEPPARLPSLPLIPLLALNFPLGSLH